VSAEQPPQDKVARTASGRRSRVPEERVDVGTAHIDVSSATILQSPQSRQQAKYLAYALCVLFVFMIAAFGTSLLFTSSQVRHVRAVSEQAQRNAEQIAAQNAVLRKQLIADCGFYRDLAGLPLASTANGHPSELLVKIISDSRGAWNGRGCPGELPPPDPSFVAGAKLYGLPVN
jgi:hypothetical protein